MKNLLKKQDGMQVLANLFLSLMMLGLPLVYDDGYRNITATKSSYFYTLFWFLMFGSIAVFVHRLIKKRFHKPKMNIKLSAIDISMLVFLFFVFLSAALSSYQDQVWSGVAGRNQGAITILFYVIAFFIVSRNYKYSKSFFVCAVISFVLVSLLGVLHCFDIDLLGMFEGISEGNKHSYVSTIGNINFYSSFMSIMLPFIIYLFCSAEDIVKKILCGVVLVIGSFGCMITASESFVIGFVFSTLFFPMLLFKYPKKLKNFFLSILIIMVSVHVFNLIYSVAPVKNVSISLLLSFVLKPYVSLPMGSIYAVCCLIMMKKPEHIAKVKIICITLAAVVLFGIALLFIAANTVGVGRFNEYFKMTDSWGTGRGKIFKACFNAYSEFSLKEKLFGIGPEAIRYVIGDTFSSNLIVDNAHNEYLHFLLTIGIFGVLSYISVIVSTCVVVIKKFKDNSLAIGFFAGLIAFWFQGIVNLAQPFTTPFMYVFITCIAGLLINERKPKEIPEETAIQEIVE